MNAEDRCFCELAPLYALDMLNDDDRRWVEAQAIKYPELAAELAEHQLTVNALPYALPSAPIAADLKERLFQRLAQEPPAAVETPSPSPLSVPALSERSHLEALPAAAVPAPVRVRSYRRTVIWFQTAGAIAALAAIALLADNFRLRQTLQTDQAIVATLQQPDSVIYSLKGTENASQASGSLVVSPGDQTAIVLVQNLPTLPVGQAYRLWAVAKGATKPAYCGQFNNHRTGTARWSLPEGVCSASVPQVLITAESATAPPVPQGTLVMKSDG